MTNEVQSSVHPLTVDTTRYDKAEGQLQTDLITLPQQTREGKTVLMQVLRHKLPVSPDDTRPKWVIACMGGGTSGAMEGAGGIKRIADAIASQTPEVQQSPISIHEVMNISHPQGAPRDQEIIDKKDLRQSARLIVDTLLDPQVRNDKTDGFILWGFSAGGGVLVEVARLLQEKGKSYKLILIDPASTSQHQDFVRKIAVNTNLDIFRHFHLQDEAKRKEEKRKNGKDTRPVTFYAQAQASLGEIRDSMTTPDGAPENGIKLIQEWFGKGKARQDDIAKKHGLPKNAGGAAPNLAVLDRDVTSEARQTLKGHVILISPVFAPTVNLFTSRGEMTNSMLQAIWGYQITHEPKYHQELFHILQQKYPKLSPREILRKTQQLTQNDYFDQELTRISHELFPQAHVSTLPMFTALHSGILRNQNIYEWAIRSVLK